MKNKNFLRQKEENSLNMSPYFVKKKKRKENNVSYI